MKSPTKVIFEDTKHLVAGLTILSESLEFVLKSNLLKVTDPYNVKPLSMTDPCTAIWPIRTTVVINIASFLWRLWNDYTRDCVNEHVWSEKTYQWSITYTYSTELLLLLLSIRGWIWNRTLYTTDYRPTRYLGFSRAISMGLINSYWLNYIFRHFSNT